jgi:hypothetical protein
MARTTSGVVLARRVVRSAGTDHLVHHASTLRSPGHVATMTVPAQAFPQTLDC